MAKLYGLNERDKKMTGDAVRRVRAGSTSQKSQKRRRGAVGGEGGSEVVLAYKEIPAATVDENGVITPGTEEVWLTNRGPEEEQYEPALKGDGTKEEETLYNFSTQSLAANAGEGGEPPTEGEEVDKPEPIVAHRENERLIVGSGQGESSVEAGNENLAILTQDLSAAENTLEVINEESVSGELKLGFSEFVEPPDGPGYNALLLARKYGSEPVPFIEDWDKIYYVPETYSAVTLFGFVTAGTRRGKVVRFSYHGDPKQKVGIVHAEDCGI